MRCRTWGKKVGEGLEREMKSVITPATRDQGGFEEASTKRSLGDF